MSNETFAVQNNNQDVCDCLVKIAQKHGYTYNRTSFHNYLHFYPVDNIKGQHYDGVQYLDIDMYRQTLSAVDDFAEIIRRLEQSPSPKEVQLERYEGEISTDGQKFTMVVQQGLTIVDIELSYLEIEKIGNMMMSQQIRSP